MRLAVLGAGAWGTALAMTLVERHEVCLWARNEDQIAELQQFRENRRYLPGFVLPSDIRLSAQLPSALAGADLALLVVPVIALDATLQGLCAVRPDLPFLWACKGMEQTSRRLPHQIVAASCAQLVPHGALSGPSFASEIASGLPAALTLAAASSDFAQITARALHHPRLRVYSSTDVVGVEVAGALKNVIAIAAGLADGLGLGLNARAALITRGLAEIARLGLALGGRRETFMGLAGVGDLVLTCTSTLSRNYQVGQGLALNTPLPEVLRSLGHVAEGVPTALAVLELAHQHRVEMPITDTIQKVLSGTLSATGAVSHLMARDPRAEF